MNLSLEAINWLINFSTKKCIITFKAYVRNKWVNIFGFLLYITWQLISRKVVYKRFASMNLFELLKFLIIIISYYLLLIVNFIWYFYNFLRSCQYQFFFSQGFCQTTKGKCTTESKYRIECTRRNWQLSKEK